MRLAMENSSIPCPCPDGLVFVWSPQECRVSEAAAALLRRGSGHSEIGRFATNRVPQPADNASEERQRYFLLVGWRRWRRPPGILPLSSPGRVRLDRCQRFLRQV